MDVSRYRVIIFHVGTNNIGESTYRIKRNFEYLVEAVFPRCPGVQICLSCILPSTLDLQCTGPQVVAINEWLKLWAPSQGIKVINAYRIFAFSRAVVMDSLYRDGLHLNEARL